MPIAKINGADIELGNFVSGIDAPQGTGAVASRSVLREVNGIPAQRDMRFPVHGAQMTPRDLERRYLPGNGGCVYIDLDHVECAQPETWSAYDHVAARHAMLRIVRNALDRANEWLPSGYRIKVLVNNSDGHSHSYGSHLNFLVKRRTWNAIIRERSLMLPFLASHQASLIVLSGQGKVGSENGRAPVDYQIAQRVDFFERMLGAQTTASRPLVNARDEALCGPMPPAGTGSLTGRSEGLARLHCIFFDSALSHVAMFLTVGTMQIVLAMLEAGEVAPGIILADPLGAAQAWSHDPSLTQRCRLADGGEATVVEHQLAVFDAAQRFASSGCLNDVVPYADDILELWHDTLSSLLHRRFDEVTGRLDWLLKLDLLSRAARCGDTPWWLDPRLRHLDQVFSSLDPNEGAYWAYEAAGLTERLVSEEEIQHFVEEPPTDTRAWARAHLLRLAEPCRIVRVNWDEITLDTDAGGTATIRLDDPRGFNRAEAHWLASGVVTLEEAARRFSARQLFGNEMRTNAVSPQPCGSTAGRKC